MKYSFLVVVSLLFPILAQSAKPQADNSLDADRKYLILENVEGETALEFVKEENTKSIEHFKKNPLFKELEKNSKDIIFDEQRIEPLSVTNGWIYSFWKDQTNPQGLWRRVKVEEYKAKDTKWDVILDLDALSKLEKKKWVWKGSQQLHSNLDLALVSLSNGGKDATVYREFNLQTKKFITNGFSLPEAKTDLSWPDKDFVLLGTDFGPNTLTTSGYAKQIRKWKRGTDFKKAELVMDIMPTDMAAYSVVFTDGKDTHSLLVRQIGFFESEHFYLKPDGEKVRLPISKNVTVAEFFQGRFILSLDKDFAGHKKGSLLALPLKSVLEKGDKAIKDLEVVFVPTKKTFLSRVTRTQGYLVLDLIDNIVSKVDRVNLDAKGKWVRTRLMSQLTGSTWVQGADRFGNYIILGYTDFLTPSSVYGGSISGNDFEVLKAAPSYFKVDNLEYKQYFAKSADGTKIPYYVVSQKNLKKDQKNPTLIYGYGGFGSSMVPRYSGLIGKNWLEKGGVYVLANLRGGGEFGPEWHQQVLKEKRYKVFEDLVAVGEDLIKKKITSPEHLGIQGGSNGGLLVGSTMVKRPDLFNAVLCQVPLLDMIRYNKLLAGASWMDEYGNPDDVKMREHILKYSPFQNVKKDVKYPEIFFMTSTKDDRVHPGHARKMAAKMKDQSHSIFYYENTDGGHAGNANQEQEVLWQSLAWTYLWEKLGSKKEN